MTEAYEDGNYLVRVRAQVMTRDDSTGGWVPMGGGGLSNVSVRKRNITVDDYKHEYLIYGKRISDQSVVLSCTIKKDFEYNKVMPTFHHWKTGDKKFGLTFQTAADARAFDKGVRTAVEELLAGIGDKSLLPKYPDHGGEEDVFMTLNLPVERGDSRSSSDSSSRSVAAPEPHHLHRIHYLPRREASPERPEKDDYSYVQLTAVHEYVEAKQRRDSGGSLKKRGVEQPPLPAKRTRCRHCQELYSEEVNGRGSCEYAPDCARSAVDTLACVWGAECMLYHCMADSEGEFARHPCECGPADEKCGKRWAGLAVLALFVPCLWCYPPLRACHWCGVACGVCGGKHRPTS